MTGASPLCKMKHSGVKCSSAAEQAIITTEIQVTLKVESSVALSGPPDHTTQSLQRLPCQL